MSRGGWPGGVGLPVVQAARGRAVGVMVVAATQRPSSDIIPTSLRDLFAWRFAGLCTTDVSSDIVLGHGWAAKGFAANEIDPDNPGAGLLIAEGGIPQRVKAEYLSDEDCADRRTHVRAAGRGGGVVMAAFDPASDLAHPD